MTAMIKPKTLSPVAPFLTAPTSTSMNLIVMNKRQLPAWPATMTVTCSFACATKLQRIASPVPHMMTPTTAYLMRSAVQMQEALSLVSSL
ncbi:hypothetical protein AALO_G00061520 [Alosa alosa]|uniref:Uncharacterized protein n=1 Tax=Alosa alosa TaxID=278164 RepID=A0AAV6H3I1_9TELE|nr:hypothetical protein AALO_G00061520 [Alosa alosa]